MHACTHASKKARAVEEASLCPLFPQESRSVHFDVGPQCSHSTLRLRLRRTSYLHSVWAYRCSGQLLLRARNKRFLGFQRQADIMCSVLVSFLRNEVCFQAPRTLGLSHGIVETIIGRLFQFRHTVHLRPGCCFEKQLKRLRYRFSEAHANLEPGNRFVNI